MLRLKNISCIIWDLDGTLIDSFKAFKKVSAEIFSELGLPMPDDETFLKNYHGSLEDTIKAITGLDDDQKLKEILEIFLTKQIEHYDKNDSDFFEDALALAKRAGQKKIKQLVLTNRDHAGRESAAPRAIIGKSIIAEYIDDILCGDEVEFRKPDVRALDGWAEKHDLKPNQMLIVGDQFVDGLLALNAGCRAVLVGRDGPIANLDRLPMDEGEIFVVKSLEEVLI